MLQFFQTVMGKAFYEGTMPSLVREIAKLNNNLEKLTALQGGKGKVVITVKGGVADVTSAPSGIEVEIVDLDTEAG